MTSVNVYREDGRVVIRAPYDMALNRDLRTLNGGKTTLDADAGVHRLPQHVHPYEVIELADRYDLATGPEFEEARTAYMLNLAESSARTGDHIEIPGLNPAVPLKGHQFPAVRYGRRNRQIINGDLMGFGKTLEALATVAADDAFPVIIACRPSLTLNWAGEIRKFFPGWDVHVLSETAAAPVLPGAHAIIIGTAALGTVDRRATARARKLMPRAPKVFGWVSVLADLDPAAFLIDEGHDAKEDTANRSQAISQLAAVVRARDGLVLDLTGTAVVSRASELAHQLEILGWLDAFGGKKSFLTRYPDDDQAALLELHRRLRAWGIMVRRSDKTILNLPPLTERILPLDPADLPQDIMTRYWLAERDTSRYLAGLAAKIAAELGTDPDDARVKAEMRARSALYLIKINTLRQIIGQAKAGMLVRWVQTQNDRGEKVVVAAHYHQVMNAFTAAFGPLTIRGGQTTQAKEADKARFQAEPVTTAPVMTVSITAGGAGHNLTAAAVGLLVELPWTPGEYDQMVHRQHRLGQTRPVFYWRSLVRGTVDERMERIVFGDKRRITGAILDGETPAENTAQAERAAAAEVAWELAQAGLAADDEPDAADAARATAGVP